MTAPRARRGISSRFESRPSAGPAGARPSGLSGPPHAKLLPPRPPCRSGVIAHTAPNFPTVAMACNLAGEMRAATVRRSRAWPQPVRAAWRSCSSSSPALSESAAVRMRRPKSGRLRWRRGAREVRQVLVAVMAHFPIHSSHTRANHFPSSRFVQIHQLRPRISRALVVVVADSMTISSETILGPGRRRFMSARSVSALHSIAVSRPLRSLPKQ